MNVVKVPNGLKFVLEAGDAEQLQDNWTENDVHFLGFLLECFMLDKFEPVAPEDIGALTDAPIFAENVVRDPDDNAVVEVGDVWWYPNYMVSHFGKQLLEAGEVIFQAAPENK